MAKTSRLNRIFELYTSDLSYKEVERLIKKEVPEVYDFYVRSIKRPEESRHNLRNTVSLIKNLFIEFLLKMSPLRRVIYTSAVIIFILGYFSNQWNWVFISFLVLNLLIAFELADKLTAKDELAVARDIQTSLMPKNPPVIKNYNVSCYIESAYEVGGDYYDFITPDGQKDKIFLLIGDISGKGMAAALYMVQVQAILKCLFSTCSDLKETLFKLNKILRKIFKPDIFLTLTVTSIDETGKLQLCRAGHLPLIHYKKSEQKCIDVSPQGLAIGISENGKFEKLLTDIELIPETGDILVFYTDGISEAMDKNKSMFGDERLKSIIEQNAQREPSELQEIILNRLDAFRNPNLSCDDVSLVILKRT